jgi:hypothetical protein
MTKLMPAAVSRSARSWNWDTVSAAPKWGTGTGSPSTWLALLLAL